MHALLPAKLRDALAPICPVHQKPMQQEPPPANPLDSNQANTEPSFHCHADGCTLYWSRENEHFDSIHGHPRYTNCTSTKQMRCPQTGHGCLYIARIDAPKNRWTWCCPVCGFSYTDAPGAWVGPLPPNEIS